MVSTPRPPLARFARYAGVVLNALTAMAWGAMGIFFLYATHGNVLLSIMPVVLVGMYVATAWGFLQRSAWALGRSYRVHALGALIEVYEIAAQHQYVYAPLLVLHVLAFFATHLAKPDFSV